MMRTLSGDKITCALMMIIVSAFPTIQKLKKMRNRGDKEIDVIFFLSSEFLSVCFGFCNGFLGEKPEHPPS